MLQDAATDAPPAEAPAAPAIDVAKAAEQLAEDPGEAITRWTKALWAVAENYGPRVIGALIIIILAYLIAGWVRRVVIKTFERAKLDKTLAKFLGNLAKGAIIIFAFITSAGTLGADTTSFAAVLAAAGLAIGLALQGNLGNLASGVLLLIFRPFKIGDAVVVAGQAGVVDGIDLFTTNIDTGDHRRIIVPNGAIFSGVIENQTHHPRRVTSVKVAVSPAVSMEDARQVLRGALDRVLEEPGAVRDPAPALAMIDLNPVPTWEAGVTCETARLGPVRERLLREVKLAVDAAKIAPPPPVQEIRIVNLPAQS